MSNPVFGRGSGFQRPSVATTPYETTNQQYAGPPPNAYGYADPSGAAQLNAAFAQPPAGPLQTGRLTYDDVLVKSFGLFGVVLVSGAVGWMFLSQNFVLILGCLMVGTVLALVNIFRNTISPALIISYGVAEGLVLGAFSSYYEAAFPGIVLQAVTASLAVFGVTLALSASGKIRTSPKMTQFFLYAMFGYVAFSLINLVLMVTGAVTDPWGLRTGVHIFGLPLGVVLGVFVVLLAAYSFLSDIESVKYAVQNGVNANFAWRAAFGFMVTLVWLYLEMLRLLAILRR